MPTATRRHRWTRLGITNNIADAVARRPCRPRRPDLNDTHRVDSRAIEKANVAPSVTCDNSRMATRARKGPAVVDVAIIGAGPVGLACAIEAQRVGLSARVFDKGTLVNSIVGYPLRMEFFSTPDLIEIGGHPFPVQGYKPTREEAIEYTAGCPRERKSICVSTSASNGSMVRPASSP